MPTRIHRPLKVIALNANGMICCVKPGLIEALYVLYIYLIILKYKYYVLATNWLLLTVTLANDRLVSSLERAPHIKKPATVRQ
jgi:hypothetical protein